MTSFIADFHIHSKYSRATAKDMDLPALVKWAKIKGIAMLGTGDFSRVAVAYSWIANRKWGAGKHAIAVPCGVVMSFDEKAVYLARRGGDANGKYQLCMEKNKPFAKDEKPLPDFRPVSKEQREGPVWNVALPVRPRALLKSGGHLFLAAMPVEGTPDDPYAGYEGRKGGLIYVASAKDGAKVAERRLDAAVVWDGLAAANGKLFVSTTDGSIRCFKAP